MDWVPILDEVIPYSVTITKKVIKREKLLIVCPDEIIVHKQLGEIDYDRVVFRGMDTSNTWVRDHGGISVFDEGMPMFYDFVLNGWGTKLTANHDNLIIRDLCHIKTFSDEAIPANMQPLVLKGGSIESNGKGTLMTTVECLTSVDRNEYLQQEKSERYLKDVSGLGRISWVTSGYLAGDGTDSHVDTLTRFYSEDTITYVHCGGEEDEYYEGLKAMEEGIKESTRANGKPYCLILLPMTDKAEWEGKCLPITYANFLIMNGTVLVLSYDSPKDGIAKAALREAFPNREIIGINCLPLIK